MSHEEFLQAFQTFGAFTSGIGIHYAPSPVVATQHQAHARALVVAKRDAQQRMFERVVRDGVRQGVFRVADPHAATLFVITACTAVAGWYRPGRGLSIDDLVERYQQLALASVGHLGAIDG